MRRLLLILTLLLVSTPAVAGQRFSFNRFDDTYGGNTTDQRNCNPPPAVPEPTALALFAAGAGVVGWKLGRRRRS